MERRDLYQILSKSSICILSLSFFSSGGKLKGKSSGGMVDLGSIYILSSFSTPTESQWFSGGHCTKCYYSQPYITKHRSATATLGVPAKVLEIRGGSHWAKMSLNFPFWHFQNTDNIQIFILGSRISDTECHENPTYFNVDYAREIESIPTHFPRSGLHTTHDYSNLYNKYYR